MASRITKLCIVVYLWIRLFFRCTSQEREQSTLWNYKTRLLSFLFRSHSPLKIEISSSKTVAGFVARSSEPVFVPEVLGVRFSWYHNSWEWYKKATLFSSFHNFYLILSFFKDDRFPDATGRRGKGYDVLNFSLILSKSFMCNIIWRNAIVYSNLIFTGFHKF